jgi:hypothetical protein
MIFENLRKKAGKLHVFKHSEKDNGYFTCTKKIYIYIYKANLRRILLINLPKEFVEEIKMDIYV